MADRNVKRRGSRRRDSRDGSPGPLIWIVLVLALAFLGFVASRIWLGYRQANEEGATSQEQDGLSDASSSGQADATSGEDGQDTGVDIELVAIGDILQHMGVFESGQQADGSYNFDHIYAHITGELEGADIKVLNQETMLGGDIAPYSGYPLFNGPQEMGDAEVAAGFNVILKATNHAMDMGYDGVHSEMSFWRENYPDVAVLGMRDPAVDAADALDDVYVYEKDGFKVALLNYTFSLNGLTDPEGAVSMLEETHVRTTMEKARDEADMIVVFPHWGTEYVLEATDEQRAWEQLLIECGADVIIGGHPHVIEPCETFETTSGTTGVCMWSVGNFVSTQAEDMNLVGALVKVSLHKDADGSCYVTAASMEPVVTHTGVGENMTTYLLRDYTDELAATNSIYGRSTTTCTPEWVQEFVSSVWGDAYDQESCTLTVPLDGATDTGDAGAADAGAGEAVLPVSPIRTGGRVLGLGQALADAA